MQISPETRSRTWLCVCAANSRTWQSLCLGTMLFLALAASDSQAGLITALGVAAPHDEIGAAGGMASDANAADAYDRSPGSDVEYLRLTESWRLLAAGRLLGGGGAAGSVASGTGFSNTSMAVGGALFCFRPSMLAQGKVAESPCLPPPLVGLEGPFHPPRNGG